MVWGELPSIESVKIKYESSMEDVDGYEVLDSHLVPGRRR